MIMEPSSTEPSPAGYSHGYSADVDTIREQEYPLLNGMNTLPHANDYHTDCVPYRNNIP